MIADPTLHHKASTRYVSPDWSATLDLPIDLDWGGIGFTPAKLSYLAKKYPLDDLPRDGCIASAADGAVVYRRVDLVRGWPADALYLQHLGWRGSVTFSAPGLVATLHAVRLSAVFPTIVRDGLYAGVHRLLRRTLKRAVVHRLERRYEHYGQAKRMNAWAHRLSSARDMQRAVDLLEDSGS